MIRLPNTIRPRRTMRVLVMNPTLWASQLWTALPMPVIFKPGGTIAAGATAGGYHVQFVTRWCLPDEDRAAFYVDTGIIGGQLIVEQDLSGMVVRIQVKDDEAFPGANPAAGMASGWKTVFLGYVLHTEHTQEAGDLLKGRTTYHCGGLLGRLRYWPLDRHSTVANIHAKGNPGYNVPLNGWFRQVLGNKGYGVKGDPFGDLAGPPDISGYYLEHKLPLGGTSASAKWTDAEAVKHALASSRAEGEPLIQVDLSAGLFDGTFSWPVNAGDTCRDFLDRVCNRQRGRGGVFLDFNDADGNVGPVYPILRANPTHTSPITYNVTNGPQDLTLSSQRTIASPTSGGSGTAVAVDLVGDHRLSRPFTYENRTSSLFDAVTVQGECIQVLANLNFFGGSLSKRWSSGFALSDQTLFGEIPADKVFQRLFARWRHVWRRFGPADTWTKTVKAEPASTAVSIDYICDEVGAIVVAAADSPNTSNLTLKFLSDLPIYEGWTYASAAPARWDEATDYLPPPRMTPVIMLRADNDVDGSPAWYPLMSAGFNIQTDDFGIYIVGPNEDATGVRYLANTTDCPNATGTDLSIPGITTTSGVDLQDLNLIAGVELGARVQIMRCPTTEWTADAGKTYNAKGRRLTLTINGCNLWLGAPGAIWELDYARAAQAEDHLPGLKFPGTDPYIIRDDRNELSFIAALAAEYWCRPHNPGTWALYDCGLMTSFATDGNSAVKYPRLGDLITTVAFATGEVATLNTAVTCIHYDHEAGETTWRTDYVTYEGAQ